MMLHPDGRRMVIPGAATAACFKTDSITCHLPTPVVNRILELGGPILVSWELRLMAADLDDSTEARRNVKAWLLKRAEEFDPDSDYEPGGRMWPGNTPAGSSDV